jgi:TonB family protein
MTDVARLLESRRARLGRWAGAALVVCAVHLGGAALAFMHWPLDEEAEDVAGAVTMELAPLPVAAPVDSPNVAHGPLMQVAMPTPEAAKEAIKEVEEDIPPVEPSPAAEPEVALPKPQPEAKEQPKEEELQEAAPEKPTPVEVQAAPLTTAPPRVEALPAPGAPKSEGRSATLARAHASWKKGLMREFERHKRVPQAARNNRGQWKAVVVFTLDRAGHVLTSSIKESSGVPALDEEALALLKRVNIPPAPNELPGDTFEYTLPITFGVD